MATYLSVLHLATAGLNGPLLGTDEEEIVQICFAVVNKNTRQVKRKTENVGIFIYYAVLFYLCSVYLLSCVETGHDFNERLRFRDSQHQVTVFISLYIQMCVDTHQHTVCM